ncbi:hypothetical protein KL86PLE_30486 [uncultured Pleomorphomonas sp.]|uniref:Uncharacterized protein n=1 Tax=uncultured Pleomorphomonas sp. TaxID=442121 RepID=A0A212LF76_9HYPH|nr:hypothetical protein KL86PLE_30486 [uncultured Pleomorphomonas sp.]
MTWPREPIGHDQNAGGGRETLHVPGGRQFQEFQRRIARHSFFDRRNGGRLLRGSQIAMVGRSAKPASRLLGRGGTGRRLRRLARGGRRRAGGRSAVLRQPRRLQPDRIHRAASQRADRRPGRRRRQGKGPDAGAGLEPAAQGPPVRGGQGGRPLGDVAAKRLFDPSRQSLGAETVRLHLQLRSDRLMPAAPAGNSSAVGCQSLEKRTE